jgi:hypothetical protein
MVGFCVYFRPQQEHVLAYCSNMNCLFELPLSFFPLSNEATECGCFKEHSEVKKEALGKLYRKREETAQVWREEKKREHANAWWYLMGDVFLPNPMSMRAHC